MNITSNRRLTIFATFATLGALLLGTLFLATPPETEKNNQATCIATNVVKTELVKQGFAPNSFAIITSSFKPKATDEVNKNGSDAFSNKPVLTTKQLDSMLKSSTGRAGLASAVVKKRLNGRAAEWVGVQFKNPINIHGNLGTNGTKIVNLGTRKSAAGDVVWFPVDVASCTLIKDLVIRAGCGNPGKSVVPTTPTIPKHHRDCLIGQNKNQNGVCVKPKSKDPKDYSYPPGKPKVPMVTTTPEAVPPKVETTTVGGRGVVDTPTKAPGSETGGIAPGATPVPTTTPTALPSNEGGSNNGTVSGF